MDSTQVVTALETIVTRAQLPDTVASLLLSDDEIEALRCAADALRDAPPPRANRPLAAGKRWDEAEDARLREAYDAGSSVPVLAIAHGRSKTAITLRLVKLGRIDAATVTVRERTPKSVS